MSHMEKLQTEKYKNRIIDWAVFAVLLAAVSAVTLTLFHRQTLGNPGWYHSDMKAYILEMQGLESKYSFPYPVFFKFAALIHLFADAELSVAIATMILNSLGIVVTKLAFNHLVLGKLERAFCCGDTGRRHSFSWLAGILVSIAAISLFFISMLYPPDGIYLPGIKYKYLGVFTPNPFHNATYMAARPFAILAFLWYVKLLPVYEKGFGNCAKPKEILRDYLLFSFFLLMATMTKPSFTLVLVSTAGLIMLYRLFRTGFRNLLPTIWLGLCFIPTFIDLLYQYRGVFMPDSGEEGGVGFCVGEVWAQCCDNIPLAVCLAVGFPLAVLVMNWRECRKSTLLCFSWQLFLVSFAEAFFLYEKGFRKFDFNFSWGYMCGIFFCHFSALAVLMQVSARRLKCRKGSENVQCQISENDKLELSAVNDAAWIRGDASGEGGTFAEQENPAKNDKVNSGKVRTALEKFTDRLERGKTGMLFLVLQWLAYLWHAACGIYYFMVIFSGAMYY